MAQKYLLSSSRFNFADVVEDGLFNYSTAAYQTMERVIREVGNEAAKKLQTQSETPRKTGKYAKSWAYKRWQKGRREINFAGGVVYAKKPGYRLAHLLENGHAKRGGGRTTERVHIEPVAAWAQDEAFERIVSTLEKMSR